MAEGEEVADIVGIEVAVRPQEGELPPSEDYIHPVAAAVCLEVEEVVVVLPYLERLVHLDTVAAPAVAVVVLLTDMWAELVLLEVNSLPYLKNIILIVEYSRI